MLKGHFLMMSNCLKILFVIFNSSKNAQLRVFWQFFFRKVLFWGAYWLLNHFLMNHWICLVEMLRLSTHMTKFWIIIFWPKKWQNWSKLKNFVSNVSITHFFTRAQIIIFWFDRYWESYHFRCFRGFNEQNCDTWKEPEK